jgi:hypothetical protein
MEIEQTIREIYERNVRQDPSSLHSIEQRRNIPCAAGELGRFTAPFITQEE